MQRRKDSRGEQKKTERETRLEILATTKITSTY